METIQFRTKIIDDSILIPAKYRGKFRDRVRVILMADDSDLRQACVESLFATAEKLAALNEPILSDAELEAEIAAARQARK
jgi:hypothetical protein